MTSWIHSTVVEEIKFFAIFRKRLKGKNLKIVVIVVDLIKRFLKNSLMKIILVEFSWKQRLADILLNK